MASETTALVSTQEAMPPAAANVISALKGFDRLPGLRQAGLIVVTAAAIAIAVAAVLWSRDPNYTMLYGPLSDADTLPVLEALRRHDIEHTLDPATGAVLVPSTDLQSARIKLAGEGLPASDSESLGYELLDRDPGFGVSRRTEETRQRRALEGELARSIASLTTVQSARVHLGLAEQSSFVRTRRPPSASVVLQLYRSRQLRKEDVAGIVHLVASSVPELVPEHVAVVDQAGRLLTPQEDQDELWYERNRFEITQRVEQNYVDRVLDILEPLVGPNGARAQVVADMDFTQTEETAEVWNPDGAVVRSEQIDEDRRRAPDASGVPGSLTNLPPQAPVDPAAAGANDESLRRQSTRNFEIDKRVSYTRLAPGEIGRLSVAVVVDHRRDVDEEGNVTWTPRSDEELAYLTALVSKAVGLDADRGDTVEVVNAPFQHGDPLPEVAGAPFWKDPWIWDAIRQAAGPLLALLVLLLVLRPTARKLALEPAESLDTTLALPDSVGSDSGTGAGTNHDTQNVHNPNLGHDVAVQQMIGNAQGLVSNDPARAAQVVREWVTEGS